MNPNDIVLEIKPEKKPKKVWPFIVVFGILVVIAATVVAVVILSNTGGNNGDGDGGDDSNSATADGSSDNSGRSNTPQYLNNASLNPDTMSIIIRGGDNKKNNIFIGFKLSNVSKNLELVPYSSMKNDWMRVAKYDIDGIHLVFGDKKSYWISNSGSYIYNPGKSDFVYNSGNYYIEYNDFFEDYKIYYKYGTTTQTDEKLKSGEEGWLALSFDSFDSKEEAIERVNELASSTEICVYTDSEGISKCKNTDSYNNLNDMILRELQKQGIYVKSYANITRIGFAGTEIVDDSREVKFRIVSMTLGSSLSDSRFSSFDVGGKKYYTDYSEKENYYGTHGGVYLPVDGGENKVIGFSISLEEGVAKTKEEIIEIFKNVFGGAK